MNVATMSPFVQQSRGERHYRCTKCLRAKGPASGSSAALGGPALRVLKVYVLVDANGDLTPLRMKPVVVVGEAPPDEWGWSRSASSPVEEEVVVANPDEQGEISKFWQYNGEESAAMWLTSSCYKGL